MKVLSIVLFVALITVISGAEQYTTKFDNVDVDQILRSDRLLRNYVNCLLDKTRCSPDGQELKKVLPDALLTGCSKCSEKQKEASRKIIRYLLKNKRNVWDQLEAKYDPTGSYLKKYAAELKKEGIQV